MFMHTFSGEAKCSIIKLRLWVRPVISLSGVAQWLLILVRLLLSVGLASLYLASSAATASAKGGLARSACAYAVCSIRNLVMVMVPRKAPAGEWTDARSALLRFLQVHLTCPFQVSIRVHRARDVDAGLGSQLWLPAQAQLCLVGGPVSMPLLLQISELQVRAHLHPRLFHGCHRHVCLK